MRRRLLIVIIFVVTFISTPFFAFALTVSPARLEISGDPGQTLQGEIILSDETAVDGQSKNYYVSFENFEPRGDSGAPYFIGAKDGLATWMQAPQSVSLNSSEEIKVPFSITIPKSTKPGGYFAAVFFGTQPPAGSGGQVSVGGKVGVLILLRVNGVIEESGGLLSFSTKDNVRFVTTPPIILEYRLNNTGGDRVVPRGTVSLKNTFRFTIDELNANKNEGSVLPGSVRKYEMVLGEQDTAVITDDMLGFFGSVKAQLKDFKFGWYTAKLDIEWGQTKQTAQDVYHFFVIPWQALVVLFSGFWFIVKGFKILLKKYNTWVLTQAGLYQQEKQSAEKKQDKKPTQEHRPKLQKADLVIIPESKKPLQKPRRKI